MRQGQKITQSGPALIQSYLLYCGFMKTLLHSSYALLGQRSREHNGNGSLGAPG